MFDRIPLGCPRRVVCDSDGESVSFGELSKETPPPEAIVGAVSATAIGEDLVGSELVVLGWVQRRRDHGGVIFVDLRDRSGLVQVVFRPDASQQAHERAGELRSEFVIAARGTVQLRSAETVNPELPTGTGAGNPPWRWIRSTARS